MELRQRSANYSRATTSTEHKTKSLISSAGLDVGAAAGFASKLLPPAAVMAGIILLVFAAMQLLESPQPAQMILTASSGSVLFPFLPCSSTSPTPRPHPPAKCSSQSHTVQHYTPQLQAHLVLQQLCRQGGLLCHMVLQRALYVLHPPLQSPSPPLAQLTTPSIRIGRQPALGRLDDASHAMDLNLQHILAATHAPN